MKLGSLKHNQKRDGDPVLVSRDNKKGYRLHKIVPSLRHALENWEEVATQLESLYQNLNSGELQGTFEIDENQFHSPLPRSFQWADGSAFIHHVVLVRKARNAPLPEGLETVPLMYQGGSDTFLAPRQEIPHMDSTYGVDFEGEVGVITGDVPMGVKSDDALKYIRLLVVINDVTLRGLIPNELKTGFGFFQGKPSSSFAPFALTPDELGPNWNNGRIHLPLLSEFNGEFFGKPNAKEMHFSFGDLISHAARTRALCAGTIIGSGTVSNDNPEVGSSCLVEKRMIEKIKTGEFKTPFMKPGDTIKIEMLNEKGENLFGTIYQIVIQI